MNNNNNHRLYTRFVFFLSVIYTSCIIHTHWRYSICGVYWLSWLSFRIYGNIVRLRTTSVGGQKRPMFPRRIVFYDFLTRDSAL